MLHLPMGWFRSQRRSWGWVALLALTLQLTLSFGHVHGPAAAHWTEAAIVANGGHNAAPQPATGDTDDSDYCAICAVLTLLTGAQAASAPVFAPPPVIASAEIVLTRQAALLGSERPAFRSRAPPQS